MDKPNRAEGELGPGDDSPLRNAGPTPGRPHFITTGKNGMLASIAAIAIGASLGALLRWVPRDPTQFLISADSPGNLRGKHSRRLLDRYRDCRVCGFPHSVAPMAIAHGNRISRRPEDLLDLFRGGGNGVTGGPQHLGTFHDRRACAWQHYNDALGSRHCAPRAQPPLGETICRAFKSPS